MAEDDDLGDLDLGDLDLGDDDDDAVSPDEAEALSEAISSVDDDGEELDPLAEGMLKMMEEEGGDDGADSGEDADQMMEMEMLKAMEEEGGPTAAALPGMAAAGGGIPPNIERLMDVRLTVTIELGRTTDTIEKVMEYGDQSLIELDKTVGEPVDVLVNGELFARGEVVTVSENFGVRIIELVNPLSHN
jgi:flagellar motor switch protein FliN